MILSILFLVVLLIPILNLLYIKKYWHAFFFFLVESAWLLLTFTMLIKAAEILYLGYITIFSIKITSETLVYFLPVWLVITVIALIVCIKIVVDSKTFFEDDI